MEIIPYLCRAERQVLAKAYASIVGCQQKQHSFFACVYQIRMTTKQLSTDSVNAEKKCLVKSGKVTQLFIVRQ